MTNKEDSFKNENGKEIIVQKTDAFFKADAFHLAYCVLKYTFIVSIIMTAFAFLIIFLKMATLVSNILFIISAVQIVLFPLIAYFLRLFKSKKSAAEDGEPQKIIINAELINSVSFVKTHKIFKFCLDFAFVHTNKYSFITIYKNDLQKIGQEKNFAV